MGRLDGKVAVITGAANGIGAAAGERFAREGARVLLVDRDEAGLRAVAAGIGTAAACLALDVAADDSATRYVAEALRLHGRVDAAVLNAGIEGEVAPIGEATLAGFDRVMAVNVRSVWLGLSALLPAMKAHGGSIVITASVAGLRATPGLAPYGASKHAAIGLMRTAAVEGARHGIRVNTVNPGPIDTRMMASIEAGRHPADPAAAHAAAVARIPLGRYGRVDEVAGMMLFLCGDEGAYCTGQTYVVDGAYMLG